MQLVVETAGVADGIAVGVPAPERRGGRVAVCTARARSSRRRLYNKRHVPMILTLPVD